MSQQRSGKGEGDCLMASAASILEIPLAELPEIAREDSERWFQIFTEAIIARGFRVAEMANDPPLAPPGYAIAIGPSPRNQGTENHAVVALDGDVVHDPHPTQSGVERIDYWLFFVPLARTPSRLSPLEPAPVL